MANVNPAQLQKIFSTMDFPVRKDQVVGRAKSVGTDSSILSLLNKLPGENFHSSDDIRQALGNLG